MLSRLTLGALAAVAAAPLAAQSSDLRAFRPTQETSFTVYRNDVTYSYRGPVGQVVDVDFDGAVYGVRLTLPGWRERGILTAAWGRDTRDSAGRPDLSLLDTEFQAWATAPRVGSGRTRLEVVYGGAVGYERMGVADPAGPLDSFSIVDFRVGTGLILMTRPGDESTLTLGGRVLAGHTFPIRDEEPGSGIAPNIGMEAEAAVRLGGLVLGVWFRAMKTHLAIDRAFAPGGPRWYDYDHREVSFRVGLGR